MNMPTLVERGGLSTGFTMGFGIGLLTPVFVRSLAAALRPGPRDLLPLGRLLARAGGELLREAGERFAAESRRHATHTPQDHATHAPARAAA